MHTKAGYSITSSARASSVGGTQENPELYELLKQLTSAFFPATT
jgi:hypothetical protein